MNVNIKSTSMIKKRKKELIQLSHGCKRTNVYVSPENWKELTNRSAYSRNWFVECRFYDPSFAEKYPKGFQYRKKFTSDDLQELKMTAKIFIAEMESILDNDKYNPISKNYMKVSTGLLHPDLPFMDALWKVRDKIPFEKDYMNLSRQLLNLMQKVIPELEYDRLKIIDVRVHHVKNILESIYTTNSVFNKHRTVLQSLFKELLQYGCVEYNPATSLSRKTETPALRKLLDDRKKAVILQYLHDHHPEFYRYTNIFHYSGGRTTELFRVQVKYVDIDNQEYKVLIKKRRRYEWETKVIIPAAVPYWRQILLESNSEDDYLFSKGLKPGKDPIDASQVEKRWRRNIKENDNIIDPISKKSIKVTENFYSWKHLFLDKLDQLQNSPETPIIPINLAQGMANHLSPETTNIYTIGKTDRNKEYLKRINLK